MSSLSIGKLRNAFPRLLSSVTDTNALRRRHPARGPLFSTPSSVNSNARSATQTPLGLDHASGASANSATASSLPLPRSGPPLRVGPRQHRQPHLTQATGRVRAPANVEMARGDESTATAGVTGSAIRVMAPRRKTLSSSHPSTTPATHLSSSHRRRPCSTSLVHASTRASTREEVITMQACGASGNRSRRASSASRRRGLCAACAY